MGCPYFESTRSFSRSVRANGELWTWNSLEPWARGAVRVGLTPGVYKGERAHTGQNLLGFIQGGAP